MKVIFPITVDNTALESSNITEDDYGVWDAGTAYAIDDGVIVTGTTHKIYQAVAATTGDNPTAVDSSKWVEISATNRWKAFDDKVGDTAKRETSIIYSIRTPSNVTGISFFGLSAKSLRVQVYDPGDVEVYDMTVDLIDGSGVSDFFEFITEPLAFKSRATLAGLPAYVGSKVDITIYVDSGNTAEVGEIQLGRVITMGSTVDGSGTSLEDFSTYERNAFGDVVITPRATTRSARYNFAAPTQSNERLSGVVESLVGRPCTFYPGDDMSAFGLNDFGYVGTFDNNLASGGTTIYTL